MILNYIIGGAAGRKVASGTANPTDDTHITINGLSFSPSILMLRKQTYSFAKVAAMYIFRDTPDWNVEQYYDSDSETSFGAFMGSNYPSANESDSSITITTHRPSGYATSYHYLVGTYDWFAIE